MYKPEHLQKWTSADPATGSKGNYAGADYSEYYLVLIKTRDSDVLERANYDAVARCLENAEEVRTNHWAVGYIDWLLIKEDNYRDLEVADRIAADLKDYPIVDEDLFSEYELEEAIESYESYGRWDIERLLERELTEKENEIAGDLFVDMHLEGSVNYDDIIATLNEKVSK